MRKTKSKSSYTNKWLSQNRQHWHEEYNYFTRIIIIDKKDAPTIVKQRVKHINRKRAFNPAYFKELSLIINGEKNE